MSRNIASVRLSGAASACPPSAARFCGAFVIGITIHATALGAREVAHPFGDGRSEACFLLAVTWESWWSESTATVRTRLRAYRVLRGSRESTRPRCARSTRSQSACPKRRAVAREKHERFAPVSTRPAFRRDAVDRNAPIPVARVAATPAAPMPSAEICGWRGGRRATPSSPSSSPALSSSTPRSSAPPRPRCRRPPCT